MNKTLSVALLSTAFLVAGCGEASDSGAAHPAEVAATGELWVTDASAALKKAKAEGKTVLMNFTGSDWCVWCKRLDREVFSTAEFKDHAENNLVLLKLDFPNRSQQPQREIEQNQELAEKYGIEGFPTIVVLNSAGEEIGRLGYQRGGPEAWLAQLERLKNS